MEKNRRHIYRVVRNVGFGIKGWEFESHPWHFLVVWPWIGPLIFLSFLTYKWKFIYLTNID